jgi:hypothetical protein
VAHVSNYYSQYGNHGTAAHNTQAGRMSKFTSNRITKNRDNLFAFSLQPSRGSTQEAYVRWKECGESAVDRTG